MEHDSYYDVILTNVLTQIQNDREQFNLFHDLTNEEVLIELAEIVKEQ